MKQIKGMLVALGIIALLIMTWYVSCGTCLGITPIRPERITNPQRIEWLEGSDPEAYPSAKEEIRNILKEELEVTPERVAFKIITNSSKLDYSFIHVFWYDNGEWWGVSLNWLDPRLTPELDKEIIKILWELAEY